MTLGKSDPSFKYTSYYLKKSPNNLYEHLSSVIKSFLIHGHVSVLLLLSTLVPLIKDELGDISMSKIYRSITMRSLILKDIDWIIIILFGVPLCLIELQYGY